MTDKTTDELDEIQWPEPVVVVHRPAEDERARIVAWLRKDAAARSVFGAPSRVLVEWYADAIERGEHVL